MRCLHLRTLHSSPFLCTFFGEMQGKHVHRNGEDVQLLFAILVVQPVDFIFKSFIISRNHHGCVNKRSHSDIGTIFINHSSFNLYKAEQTRHWIQQCKDIVDGIALNEAQPIIVHKSKELTPRAKE